MLYLKYNRCLYISTYLDTKIAELIVQILSIHPFPSIITLDNRSNLVEEPGL